MHYKLHKLCEKLNLRVAVIFLGLIGIIFSIAFMYLMFYGVGERNYIEMKMSAKNLLILLFVLGVLLSFIKCISDIMLIGGAINSDPRGTKAWLFINAFEIVFLLWIIPLFTYAIWHYLMVDFYFWSGYVMFNVAYLYAGFIVYYYHKEISEPPQILIRSDSIATISTILSEYENETN